jgi:hypothetical protein
MAVSPLLLASCWDTSTTEEAQSLVALDLSVAADDLSASEGDFALGGGGGGGGGGSGTGDDGGACVVNYSSCTAYLTGPNQTFNPPANIFATNFATYQPPADTFFSVGMLKFINTIGGEGALRRTAGSDPTAGTVKLRLGAADTADGGAGTALAAVIYNDTAQCGQGGASPAGTVCKILSGAAAATTVDSGIQPICGSYVYVFSASRDGTRCPDGTGLRGTYCTDGVQCISGTCTANACTCINMGGSCVTGSDCCSNVCRVPNGRVVGECH